MNRLDGKVAIVTGGARGIGEAIARTLAAHGAFYVTDVNDTLGMLGSGPDRDERLQQFVRDTPLRRFGTVEEVAAVALLLASDDAAYMTGAELNIDGGILARSAAPPRA